MVPAPIHPVSRYPRLTYSLLSLATHQISKFAAHIFGTDTSTTRLRTFVKREEHDGKFIAFACLLPILVLLSGLFAGLTLGYMSLDETQLQVLSISGTPKQKAYAAKIQPVRRNGHLLLVTLLLANMIVNETLPVISEPVLGGGPESVVVSTVLIVIFSEIIPQSLCTRYGLAIGANMVWFVRILIYSMGIVSWPVAKILELVLGQHHGIMYRRAELKELIALHSATGELGGDLKTDTVAIIGATLDLQEKVVRQAMTPIEKVFMLSINSKLDYETMKRICDTGHSRVPVYEEIDVPVVTAQVNLVPGEGTRTSASGTKTPDKLPDATQKVKKIVGILLVKQCVLLDPKDATPLRSISLNKMPCVPFNEPILNILDKFQEGRSHMAIVSRMGDEKAASVKREVKKGLTRRLKERVGMSDSSSESSSEESANEDESSSDHDGTLRGDAHGHKKRRKWQRKNRKRKSASGSPEEPDVEVGNVQKEKERATTVQTGLAKALSIGREQSLPDDAVLGKQGAADLDPAVMPLGIITMEDVVEELIGEEIYDEFDPEGQSRLVSYLSPDAKRFLARKRLVAPARAEVTADLMQRTAVTGPSSPTFKPSGFASSSQGHALTITPRSPSPALSEASVHAVLRSGPGNVTPLRTRSIASTIAGAGRAIAKAGRSRSRHRANTAPEEREAFESHSEKIPEDKTQG